MTIWRHEVPSAKPGTVPANDARAARRRRRPKPPTPAALDWEITAVTQVDEVITITLHAPTRPAALRAAVRLRALMRQEASP